MTTIPQVARAIREILRLPPMRLYTPRSLFSSFHRAEAAVEAILATLKEALRQRTDDSAALRHVASAREAGAP